MRLLFILFSIILLSCNNRIDIEYPSGGYEFSKNIKNKDFYCYLLIEKMSRRDSFFKTYMDAHFFKLFDEPNISLAPSAKPIVRLVYASFIFTLTENEITVKSTDDRTRPRFDINKLTPIERSHYRILNRNYPLDEARPVGMPPIPVPPRGPDADYEKMLDSIRNNTPVLLKREYFDFLLKKAASPDTFSFSTIKVKISPEQFKNFISKLNQSGYWNLPFKLTNDSCAGTGDARFVSLEINTGKKYNYVESTDACSLHTKFYKVCQELLIMANVKDPEILIWNLP